MVFFPFEASKPSAQSKSAGPMPPTYTLTPYGNDVLGVRRLVLDFHSQAADIYVYNFFFPVVGFSPNMG